MAEPQRAVFLLTPDSVPPGEWQRLYYGAEFCPWHFPPLTALRRFLQTARHAGLPATVVTPVVYEPFLPRLREALTALLPELHSGDEILVSDLGALRLVRDMSSSVELVLGRVLSGQKRGPRILDLELNPAEHDYFRQGRWYQQEAVAYLAEHGVRRIELDNLLQGIAPLPSPLTGTLHLPYAMVTSSRNCPFRPPGRTGACPGGCGEPFRLTTPQTRIPLYQAGNTQFIENPQPPDDLTALRIDRVVQHLRLPH